jgi:Zn-finger nucleic acid-binding protein
VGTIGRFASWTRDPKPEERMNCPRCDRTVLDERERNGVTVDVCPQCRGVWLDRGELEKMLAFAGRELEQERARYGYEREPPSSDRRGGYPPGRSGDPRHGHYRKKSWLENLGDIFD